MGSMTNSPLSPHQFASTHDLAYKYAKVDEPYGAEPPEGLSPHALPEHHRSLSFHHMLADRQETSPQHLAQITADVARRGVQEPIGIDRSTTPPTISDGHTRLMAAYLAGHKRVPVRDLPIGGADYKHDRS
jgi:hypothetical protein